MEDLVDTFLSFTGAFDRGTAVKFLEGTNNNIERAVGEYYENPDPSRFAKSVVKWDDSQFSGDREGARSQIEEVPPFQLNDDVRGRSQLQSLTAPSRPPSRTASRASQRTLRGSDVEMNENVSAGTDLDDDLQKAIRMSMLDAQESGTMDSAGHEIVPDVDVLERSRQRSEPAFLKPLSGKDFLPSLVTILHSIPRCRHLLLAKHDLLLNYGQNTHWWSGESIEVSRVMDLDHNYGRDSMDILDGIHEIQRLMAFLDKTNRAYGSAAALARLPAINESYSMDGGCQGFLNMCEKSSRLIQSNANQPSLFLSSTASANNVPSESVTMLKLGLNDIPAEAGSTLYDVLDRYLNIEAATGVWLERLAPVLVLRLPSKPAPYSVGNSSQIIVPSALYADRYHVANKGTMHNMYIELTDKRKIVEGFESKLARIENFKSSALDKPGSTAALLQTTMAYFEKQKQIHAEEATEASSAAQGLSSTQVFEKLQTIYEQLNERVKDLQKERKQAQASLRELSQLLTSPTEGEGVQPTMRYHLLGIATVAAHHAETYIRSSIPAAQTGDDPQEWWRFTYDTGGRGTSALMMREALTEATVLSSAGKLEETTLLVFANDAMLDTSGLDTELPDALKDFVNTDNAVFQAELLEYQARAAQAQSNIPQSPPPEYEPPPYPPPGDRMMNYDGPADEKETVDPANLTLAGSDTQEVQVHAVEEENEEKMEDGKHEVVQETEEDVEMTDVST